jgi:hypothetical protein
MAAIMRYAFRTKKEMRLDVDLLKEIRENLSSDAYFSYS